jgi:hypothetical protein
MGDSKRAPIFTAWLVKRFPPGRFPMVADLAGGKGGLSYELAAEGYRPTVFDTRRRASARKYPPFLRRDVDFLHFAPKEFDLVVGMHPDEATWHVIRLAHETRSPFAVVPCCVMLPEEKRGKIIMSFDQWLNWLRQQAINLGFVVEQGQLKMSGKNDILWGIKPTQKQGGSR